MIVRESLALKFVMVKFKNTTLEPQLSGPHSPGFSVNRTMEITALLE